MLYSVLFPYKWHLIDSIDLIFHEAGHTILFFMPDLLTALAGSFFQVFIPLIIVLHFYLKGEKISSFIILSWLGQSIVNVSVYVRDSTVMQLNLLGGDSVNHDWNYILDNLDSLKYSNQIGNVFYLTGLIIITISIISIVYLKLKKISNTFIIKKNITTH